jgi:hypothetical protein
LEGNEKRRINLVAWAFGILFVGAAFLTYYLVSGAATNVAVNRNASRYPAVVVYERQPTGAQTRAQRVVIKQREDGVAFIDILDAESPAFYADKGVEIPEGAVVDVIGDQVFTLGPSPEESLLIHIDKATDCLQWFKPGQRVYVDGAVLAMPDAATLQKWGVTTDEKNLAGKRKVYLEASSVHILDRDAETRDGC